MTLIHRALRGTALSLAVILLAGCASDERVANQLVTEMSSGQASNPLGGEALIQRKIELDRVYRDLVHFDATLESLHHREDRVAMMSFNPFLDEYMAKHAYPLLKGEWQSKHPEVSLYDVNVRLMMAELWFKLGYISRTDAMLRQIVKLYAGRGEMLVSYPPGRQSTLRAGVERLRDRAWWNG